VNKLESLFAEFILSKIDNKYNSKIEICSCDNFTIVKGETESEEILSIQKISEEFYEKYPDYRIKNTIDLLEYKSKLQSKFDYTFTFYKDSVPEIDISNYFKLSSFPFGYSLSEGKSIYFYFKYITNKIPPTYPFNWIKYKIKISDSGKIDFDIEDDYINNQDNILKSVILDVFNFNIMEFESEAKKMDLEQMILNPSHQEQILEKPVPDFIII
jgi:hypothetical protein